MERFQEQSRTTARCWNAIGSTLGERRMTSTGWVKAWVVTQRFPGEVAVTYVTPPRWKRTTLSTRMSRSEEHTSELQSRLQLVCRLLLEKKKKKRINIIKTT